MCSVNDEVYLVMDRVIYAIVRRYGREKSGVRAGVISHMSLFRAAANTLGSPEELASQGCCGTDLRWGPPSSHLHLGLLRIETSGGQHHSSLMRYSSSIDSSASVCAFTHLQIPANMVHELLTDSLLSFRRSLNPLRVCLMRKLTHEIG